MPDCVLSSAIFLLFAAFQRGCILRDRRKKRTQKNGSKKKDAKKTGGHKIHP